MNAQTSIKIVFEQPERFQVEPKTVSLDLQGASLTLGGEVTVEGGIFPYSYLWTADEKELSESSQLQVDAPGVYTLEVSDGNNCKCSVQYNVAGETSLTSFKKDGLTVFPVPSKGIVYIVSSPMEEIRELQIITPVGKVCSYQKKSTDNPLQSELDIRHLPDGLYFLTIRMDDRVITKTILLKKQNGSG